MKRKNAKQQELELLALETITSQIGQTLLALTNSMRELLAIDEGQNKALMDVNEVIQSQNQVILDLSNSMREYAERMGAEVLQLQQHVNGLQNRVADLEREEE